MTRTSMGFGGAPRRSPPTSALSTAAQHRSRACSGRSHARHQRPFIVRQIVRDLRGQPGPHVVHGFGAWSDSAVAASRALARVGVTAVPVGTAWTTGEHEGVAKLDSALVQHDRRLRLLQKLEYAWVRASLAGVERRAYRACRVVTVNYAAVGGLLERSFGPGLEIRQITYAARTAFADDDRPTEPPAPAPVRALADRDAPLVVAVSRHDPRKGLEVLIAALAGLRDAGVTFRACLVSSGVLYEEHVRLVDELGLGDRVALPGRVDDVMAYLRHADVYVLPSLEEGSGAVSVLEALQAGTAIVATNVDGLPEDLTDGHDALLVPPANVGDLQRALARLLADEPLRRRLGSAGRATYEARFTPERAAADLAALYAELGLEPT